MEREDKNHIREKINELSPWFHNIHINPTLQTAPDHRLGDFPAFKWEKISPHLPQDMTSLKVLDIGCNAGFYSLECAKRGAKITAIDLDTHYLKQASWLAKTLHLNKKISFHQMQVYDLIKKDWKFDIVFFLGVFYHLRYPLLALDIVSAMTKDLMIFQSLSLEEKKEMETVENFDFEKRKIMQEKGWPSMAFIEKKFSGDPTNWWVPNPAAIKAMCRTAGFQYLHNPGHEIFFFKKDPKVQSVSSTWNESEFLSATGRSWKQKIDIKIGR